MATYVLAVSGFFSSHTKPNSKRKKVITFDFETKRDYNLWQKYLSRLDFLRPWLFGKFPINTCILHFPGWTIWKTTSTAILPLNVVNHQLVTFFVASECLSAKICCSWSSDRFAKHATCRVRSDWSYRGNNGNEILILITYCVILNNASDSVPRVFETVYTSNSFFLKMEWRIYSEMTVYWA